MEDDKNFLALKKARTQNRRLFTRSYNDFINEEDKLDVSAKIEKLKLVEEKALIMIDCEEKFKQMLYIGDMEEQSLESEIDESEEYIDRWRSLQLKLKSLEISLSDDVSSVESGSVSRQNSVLRYPKIQLPSFDGDVRNWLRFWSQFQKIDKDIKLDLHDKFAYLSQSMEKGSIAEELIKSFPPTGDSYERALKHLQNRFGKEEMLIQVYVRELLTLVLQKRSMVRKPLRILYDQIETKLRALEVLGVTREKYAAMLFPLVESALPDETLRAWERFRAARRRTRDLDENVQTVVEKSDLDSLLEFLEGEVEGEERISLATSGFGSTKNEEKINFKVKKTNLDIYKNKIPTAAGLLTTSVQEVKKPCAFCEGKHHSSECFSAQKMTLAERKNILKGKGCCFCCLASGHRAKFCRVFLKCIICGKKHVPMMCENLDSLNKTEQEKNEPKSTESEATLSNFNKNPKVFLQTLKVKLISDDKETEARAILDSGSQRSYILSDMARKMGYISTREETVTHSLFGGIDSEECKHKCYKIRLGNLNKTYVCNFEAMDQPVICESIIPVNTGPWLEELRKLKIKLTDLGSTSQPIHILIGADVLGRLMTGQRKVLSSGLVAIETFLGWTLLGKVPQEKGDSSSAMLVTSLFVKEANISSLWELDLIGIKDPIEKISKEEQERLTIEHFRKTVKYMDGRYEVQLPWKEDCVPLPDNLELAKRRLNSTTKKLLSDNLFEDYEKVLLQWLEEGIIEDVPVSEIGLSGNYLPHRPVIKMSSSTTPIRPVFDASAKMKNQPSLNQCLQTGPNLIELIPDILLRFREKKIGMIADIRKAFLQISICKEDRNFLRFLWWKNRDCQELRMFRHTRVVFGVSSSPFLLEAVLKHHINRFSEFDPLVVSCLSNSFYVDNLITSVDDEQDWKRIFAGANDLLKRGGFELRDWVSSSTEMNHTEVSELLGIKWNAHLDVLMFNLDWLQEMRLESITKRTMLSVAHKVFDPFGFASPVMLCPKLMLQKTWKKSLGWDDEVEETLRKEFVQWFEDLDVLKQVSIPRWIKINFDVFENCVLHIFCDASKDAYAAVVFLVHLGEYNEVFLLSSRSRIAPLKVATIPRLELLAALMGARLADSVIKALGWKSIQSYYWSDSTTVLSWITQDENWSVFVKNRVDEIRKLSEPSSWGHISGEENPADLPSRGCKAS